MPDERQVEREHGRVGGWEESPVHVQPSNMPVALPTLVISLRQSEPVKRCFIRERDRAPVVGQHLARDLRMQVAVRRAALEDAAGLGREHLLSVSEAEKADRFLSVSSRTVSPE